MKKASYIIFIIFAVIFGLEFLGGVMYTGLSFLAEVFDIIFVFAGREVLNTLTDDETIRGVKDILIFLSSGIGLVMLSINLVWSIFLLTISGLEFGLMVFTAIKCYKAKNKKQGLFPAIVAVVYAALAFMLGNYIYLAAFAVPAIFLFIMSDADYQRG